MKNLSPWALLLLVSCSTASNEGADSTLVAVDTLANDLIDQAQYMAVDTSYTEIIQPSMFKRAQIDARQAFVYNPEGLEVFGSATGTESMGRVEYRSALSLTQPLVNNAPGDTTVIGGLRGHFVEISFNGKSGYVFSGSLLNLPVPDSDAVMADYFVKSLHLIQPAERFTHECDCEDLRSEATYKYESGITVQMGSYYESYNNYVEFDKNVSIQEVFLIARILLPHFPEYFAGGYPAGARKEEKENGSGVEVITDGERITAIVVVTGEGCYEEESIRITPDGNVRLSANGGC